MGYVELAVDCMSPLFIKSTNAAFISLCSHVLTVKRVALRFLVKDFLSAHSFDIRVGTDHTFAETRLRVRHRAAAEHIEASLIRSTLLKDNLATLIRISGCAVVWRICLASIEHDLISLRALRLILS